MSGEAMSLERIQAILDSSPFIRFFGIRAVSADPSAGVLVLEMTLRADLERLQGSGQWHGGALAGLIDTAGDFALVLSIGAPVPTINFRVDYLRPAMTPKLIATASVRRLGRTIAVVDIDVADTQGRIVAVGRGCYGAQAG